MALTPYEYDFLHQHTCEDYIISQSHDISPRFINVELTNSTIHESVVEHDYDDDILMGRALGESTSKFESSNYGTVPAKEPLVKEMVKMVKVEVGNEEDCMICLEELEVGFYAFWMPYSHTFHCDCIEKWLKQSHYCPTCRLEMPKD
ncbi:E3 ubiquitin-protein ligase SIRP1-like [Gossypium raimondii]|uniref:E3 ubiquitin-protein ligase SIRP1-like n=1 Tax=Gossypium raimondii TaxID=29730 RepID=UPI00063AB256|nr:E3 ubiquitin-protein ligase SIRP1-like [Gossypium raimondii]